MEKDREQEERKAIVKNNVYGGKQMKIISSLAITLMLLTTSVFATGEVAAGTTPEWH